MTDDLTHVPLRFDPDSREPLPVEVISVQSQVVYGAVGNSAAVPTLLQFGHNVVCVPTVLFSNTPHYGSFHGGPVPEEWFAGYLEDLVKRGALRRAKAVLIGYLGSAEQARLLADWLERQLEGRPDLLVVVDPVMGDYDTGVYVKTGIPEAIRERLAPLASGLVPNGFEFGELTGEAPRTLEETIAAAQGSLARQTALAGRTRWVVVTSAPTSGREAGEAATVVAWRGGHEVLEWRELEFAAKGMGDVFSAALTSGLLRGAELPAAVASAHEHCVKVLERTARLNSNELVLNDPA